MVLILTEQQETTLHLALLFRLLTFQCTREELRLLLLCEALGQTVNLLR